MVKGFFFKEKEGKDEGKDEKIKGKKGGEKERSKYERKRVGEKKWKKGIMNGRRKLNEEKDFKSLKKLSLIINNQIKLQSADH